MQKVEIRLFMRGDRGRPLETNRLPKCTFTGGCVYKKYTDSNGHPLKTLPRCGLYPDTCNQQQWGFEPEKEVREH